MVFFSALTKRECRFDSYSVCVSIVCHVRGLMECFWSFSSETLFDPCFVFPERGAAKVKRSARFQRRWHAKIPQRSFRTWSSLLRIALYQSLRKLTSQKAGISEKRGQSLDCSLLLMWYSTGYTSLTFFSVFHSLITLAKGAWREKGWSRFNHSHLLGRSKG